MTVALPRAGIAARPTWIATAAPQVAVNPLVQAALYLFVLSIPFEIPKDRPIPIEIPTLTGFLFLGSTLLNPVACYGRLRRPILWFAAYLWVFVLAATINVEDYPGAVAHLFIEMSELVLIFWAGSNLMTDERIRRGVLVALVIAVAARAAVQVLGIAATVHQQWTGGERVTAFGQNANLSAIILSAGLVATVGLRLGVITWPLGALIGLAIIETGSRGGLLCAVIGLLWFITQGRTPWIRLRNAVMGLVAIGVLVVGAMQSEVMSNRFEQTAEQGNLAGRERIYPAVLGMIAERPVLGWGPIQNQFELERRLQEPKRHKRDAHNLLFELLSATGIAGAVPFLVGLGGCVVAAWRARRGTQGTLPLALLSAVLVGTISGTWIASNILWLALAQALAAGNAVAEAPPCAA